MDAAERGAATILYRGLARAEAAYDKGERTGSRLVEIVRAVIEAEPLVRLEYVSVADADTLEKLDKLDNRTVLVSLAARFGKTRLIDNIVLNPSRQKTHPAVDG